jgi:hypothetical protein
MQHGTWLQSVARGIRGRWFVQVFDGRPPQLGRADRPRRIAAFRARAQPRNAKPLSPCFPDARPATRLSRVFCVDPGERASVCASVERRGAVREEGCVRGVSEEGCTRQSS